MSKVVPVVTNVSPSSLNTLCPQVMEKLGREDEAEAMYRRTLAGREEVLGKHHPVKNISLAFSK
jgi:hypothetical protein